jgi:HK97 gp10 family phage protein
MATIEVKGVKEFSAKLKALPDKVSKRFMAAAMKKGAEPILADAVGGAPFKSGNLASQMNISSRSTQGETQVRVGVGDAYYAIMSEGGAVGPGKRIQKKVPFMGPALERNAAEATAITAMELKAKIENEMAKATA